MNINIHSVIGIVAKHEHHWADKDELGFFVLRLAIIDDDTTIDINLYSQKPFEFEVPEPRVIE
jgi:hypothetical protein